MLYEFRCGSKATVAAKNICEAFGEQALSESVCQQWFSRFMNDDLDLNDKGRTGRPKETEDDAIQALLLDEDPCQSKQELARKLRISPLSSFGAFAPDRKDSESRKMDPTSTPRIQR